jgi:hypothetical protein
VQASSQSLARFETQIKLGNIKLSTQEKCIELLTAEKNQLRDENEILNWVLINIENQQLIDVGTVAETSHSERKDNVQMSNRLLAQGKEFKLKSNKGTKGEHKLKLNKDRGLAEVPNEQLKAEKRDGLNTKRLPNNKAEIPDRELDDPPDYMDSSRSRGTDSNVITKSSRSRLPPPLHVIYVPDDPIPVRELDDPPDMSLCEFDAAPAVPRNVKG